MKFHSRPLLLAALLWWIAAPASATQMKAPLTEPLAQTAGHTTPAQTPANPWPSLASLGAQQQAPLLAYDDHYRHDGRWHSRREEARRAEWRREQARREAERRRQWERHHHHRR